MGQNPRRPRLIGRGDLSSLMARSGTKSRSGKWVARRGHRAGRRLADGKSDLPVFAESTTPPADCTLHQHWPGSPAAASLEQLDRRISLQHSCSPAFSQFHFVWQGVALGQPISGCRFALQYRGSVSNSLLDGLIFNILHTNSLSIIPRSSTLDWHITR